MRCKNLIAIAVAFALVLLMGALSPVEADEWNKRTIVDFDQPVRLPGNVTLPPGEYVFQLEDSLANRHIVKVTNPEGDKTFATVLAISDSKLAQDGKTIMTFGEAPRCAPRTLKTWYYPGDTIGQRFVYSEDESQGIASGCGQPVPTIATNEMEKFRVEPKVAQVTRVYVHTPEKEEHDYDESYFSDYDSRDTTGYEGRQYEEPVQMAQTRQPRTTDTNRSTTTDTSSNWRATSNEQLPGTASNTPLIGLLALMLLAVAGGLYAMKKRRLSS